MNQDTADKLLRTLALLVKAEGRVYSKPDIAIVLSNARNELGQALTNLGIDFTIRTDGKVVDSKGRVFPW